MQLSSEKGLLLMYRRNAGQESQEVPVKAPAAPLAPKSATDELGRQADQGPHGVRPLCFCGTGRHGNGTRLAQIQPQTRHAQASLPWQFLYFFPLPHGQGSLRPTLGTGASPSRPVSATCDTPPSSVGAV